MSLMCISGICTPITETKIDQFTSEIMNTMPCLITSKFNQYIH